MKRTITILLAALVIVALGQETIVPPRPRSATLAAADNVRNLVASMRMEAMAARDKQAAIVEDLVDLASACETARKSVESLSARVASKLDSNRTGLANAESHVRAFDEELESINRLISRLEDAQ